MKHQSGFSLMEILIAMAILALLGAVVLGNFGGAIGDAKYQKAKSDFGAFEQALERYYMDNGFYPSSDQGLQALVSRPSGDPEPNSYPKGGYIRKLQKDPWGGEYYYLDEEDSGTGNYLIISFGADKTEGGQGQKSDITSDNADEVIQAVKNGA